MYLVFDTRFVATNPTVHLIHISDALAFMSLYKKLYGLYTFPVPVPVPNVQPRSLDARDAYHFARTLYTTCKTGLAKLYTRYVVRPPPPSTSTSSNSFPDTPDTPDTEHLIDEYIYQHQQPPALLDLDHYQPPTSFYSSIMDTGASANSWCQNACMLVATMVRQQITSLNPSPLYTCDHHATIVRYTYRGRSHLTILSDRETTLFGTHHRLFGDLTVTAATIVPGLVPTPAILTTFDRAYIDDDAYFLRFAYQARKAAHVVLKPCSGKTIRPIFECIFRTFAVQPGATDATVPLADLYVECMEQVRDFKTSVTDFINILMYLGYFIQDGKVNFLTRRPKLPERHVLLEDVDKDAAVPVAI